MQKKCPIITYSNIPAYLIQNELNAHLYSYVGALGYSIDQLTYNFVSKEKLLEINQQFLQHHTHTDIISFDYSKNKSLRAEFFISLWAVSQSAKESSQTIENETIRVIIHGLLHCLGYNDDTEMNKNEMRALEDKFIETFHVKHKTHV